MLEISVVIPTYRRPHLLKNCLAALMHQSFSAFNYEIIVVSDGPDGLTEKAIKELGPHNNWLRLLQTQARKGPAAARNYGWQHANGILVAFTDDDTIPGFDWLKEIWSAYKWEKEIAYTGKITVPLSNHPTDYEKNTAGLETAEFVTANCCCTRQALEKVGGFDEQFSMAWREDSDLEFKLLVNNIPIRHLSNAIVVHPVRRVPWGISIQEQKKGMYNALLYKKYPGLYRQKIQTTPPWNYYIMVLSVFLFLAGIITNSSSIAILSFGCWLVLLVGFIHKRLKHTSRSASHVTEMIVTSLLIPFVSVYWQLYGAWRHKVFFL